ncbi:hypothetical protein SESBI_32403 [Sesbania bispinosa]|nr:hypothetical protein SESBI_32403 [Sesbania bispinosa]
MACEPLHGQAPPQPPRPPDGAGLHTQQTTSFRDKLMGASQARPRQDRNKDSIGGQGAPEAAGREPGQEAPGKKPLKSREKDKVTGTKNTGTKLSKDFAFQGNKFGRLSNDDEVTTSKDQSKGPDVHQVEVSPAVGPKLWTRKKRQRAEPKPVQMKIVGEDKFKPIMDSLAKALYPKVSGNILRLLDEDKPPDPVGVPFNPNDPKDSMLVEEVQDGETEMEEMVAETPSTQ